jgi:AraC-like DNA-binding protein
MPSALAVRKFILQVLEDSVLPAFTAPPEIPVILAELPMAVPPHMKVTHLPVPPLPTPPRLPLKSSLKTSHLIYSWPKEHVHAQDYPYLVFVCEGEADLRMGVTTEMAQRERARLDFVQKSGTSEDAESPHTEERAWIESGCHILPAKAATMLFFPPGIPYSDGSRAHWRKENVPGNEAKIVWIHVLPVGVLCHVSSSRPFDDGTEHALLVRDEVLPQLIEILAEELRQRVGDYRPIAKSLLLTLFLRIQRCLIVDKPIIGNTAWKKLPNHAPNAVNPQSSASKIIIAVDEYVQIFLTQPISLPQLAAHCGVSPTHLNRIFNSVLGISVKRYVTQQRVQAAQTMLLESELAIKEISNLVGFRQITHFCQVFRDATQMSPRQYRDYHRPGVDS